MAPPHTMRCAEESQKLPIITLCLSTVHPICAVMIWAFEALMAALAGKIMAPIIFNELHQEVSMGPLSLEQRHVGNSSAFLSSKWLWVCVKPKNTAFPFQRCWIWKDQERQLRKKHAWVFAGALRRGWMYIRGALLYRIDKFSRVKPALPSIFYS